MTHCLRSLLLRLLGSSVGKTYWTTPAAYVLQAEQSTKVFNIKENFLCVVFKTSEVIFCRSLPEGKARSCTGSNCCDTTASWEVSCGDEVRITVWWVDIPHLLKTEDRRIHGIWIIYRSTCASLVVIEVSESPVAQTREFYRKVTKINVKLPLELRLNLWRVLAPGCLQTNDPIAVISISCS